MKIGIIEHIDSMHLLPGHPKCGVPHGHTYTVDVMAEGPVVNGMVMDFDTLKTEIRRILKDLDHTDLNKFLQYPSCENICLEIHRRIKERIKQKITVRVWEGDNKWAEHSEG